MLLLVTLFLCCTALTCAETADLPHSYHFEPSNSTFVKDYLQLPADARSLSPTFQTDRPPGNYKSTSQVGQDTMILSIFGDKNDGYFVDLAANHFVQLSNSYTLEQWNDWKGVCIEPNPMYLEGLLANRKCKIFTCAVGKTDGEIVKFRFHQGRDGVYGGIVGEEFDNAGGSSGRDKEVASVSLTTLLNFAGAPSVMDYMSLDVEGAEFYVVHGLDHSKYKFLVVTVERPNHKTHHALAKAGYRFVYQISEWGECMYFHRSMENYAEQAKKFFQPPGGWGIGGHMSSHQPKPYLTRPSWDQEHYQDEEPK